MQKNILKILCIGIACIHLSSSCRKEESGSPVIHITNPASGQQFKVGDTVFVMADIRDDREITSVSVGLLNGNYISAGNNFLIPVSGNHADIRFRYVIDNLNLATGNYFIVVKASDGQGETNAYVNIHITEMPRVRKGIYFFSAANDFSFKVSKLDSMNQPIPVISVNGDYTGSAVYSVSHELYTIGKTTGAFNAFDLNNNSLLWTHPATSTIVPTFKNLFFENDVVYVSYYDGNIKGYDKTGSQRYQVQQQGYFIPDVIFKNDQYFFAELYYMTAHQNKIGVFDLVSGVESQEHLIDIDIRNMYAPDNDHLLLFGNDTTTGQGKIERYNIAPNGTNVLNTIAAGILYRVVQIDHSNYLISHSDGIFLYDYATNALAPFVTGFPVYSIGYDDLNQEVFACSGNEVHVYNFTTGSLEYTITNSDSVMDVRVWYNK